MDGKCHDDNGDDGEDDDVSDDNDDDELMMMMMMMVMRIYNKNELRSDGKVADWLQRCVIASDDDDDVDDDDVDDNDGDMLMPILLLMIDGLFKRDSRTDTLGYWNAMDKYKKVEDNSEAYY